jgi:hypothetical protein
LKEASGILRKFVEADDAVLLKTFESRAEMAQPRVPEVKLSGEAKHEGDVDLWGGRRLELWKLTSGEHWTEFHRGMKYANLCPAPDDAAASAGEHWSMMTEGGSPGKVYGCAGLLVLDAVWFMTELTPGGADDAAVEQVARKTALSQSQLKVDWRRLGS